MPILAHLHDWTAGVTGYRCQSQACSAIMSDVQVQANIPSDANADAMAGDPQSILNACWAQIPPSQQI